MIKNLAISSLIVLFLSGWGVTTATKVTTLGDRMLANILDSKPDGHTSTLGASGASYEIVSTKISSSGVKLCRVVSIRDDNAFKVETYCKMKGGNWQ